ncbi:MAG: Crp/Fnr family transcriptional regulator [Chloroflexaceae bacterium]|nr:Crp/Fnr family transcriptional regulator [Chloroflexaceae bacterium]
MVVEHRDRSEQDEDWQHLASYGVERVFHHDCLIYTPNQSADTLYLLQSGQVSLYLLSSGGRVLTLQVVDAGQLFGHSVLAQSQMYDTFAEAVKAVQVVAVNREAMIAALEDRPQMALTLIETLGQYRLRVSRRLDEVAFKSVPARLASLLLDMAASYADGQPSRLPHRTHQQLADMINAYRETVTKVINQFRAAHILDIDRSGITLLNLNRLRELAQG